MDFILVFVRRFLVIVVLSGTAQSFASSQAKCLSHYAVNKLIEKTHTYVAQGKLLGSEAALFENFLIIYRTLEKEKVLSQMHFWLDRKYPKTYASFSEKFYKLFPDYPFAYAPQKTLVLQGIPVVDEDDVNINE